MKRRYVPIDENGMRVPVSEWTRKDHVTFDGALPRGARDDHHDEVKDPESTNAATIIKGATGLEKPRHKVTGGLMDNYRSGVKAEDDEDDELSDELIESLCGHAGEQLGFSDEMVEKLRGRLRGQAQDEPPDAAGGGTPRTGGQMTPFKSGRNLQKAMDAKRVRSFASRFPEAARISEDRMTNKRDVVPPQLALDTAKKKARAETSFERRWPEAARVKQCY